MSTVDKLLRVKGNTAWTIAPESTVYEALEVMFEKEIGSLLVVDDDGKLIGIFTERDYARKLILQGRFSKDTAVKDLMTHDVLYVGPKNTVVDCMRIMTNKRVRHIPVLKEGQILGIVTIGDVVKQIMSEQESTIHQLENYISGGY